MDGAVGHGERAAAGMTASECPGDVLMQVRFGRIEIEGIDRFERGGKLVPQRARAGLPNARGPRFVRVLLFPRRWDFRRRLWLPQ